MIQRPLRLSETENAALVALAAIGGVSLNETVRAGIAAAARQAMLDGFPAVPEPWLDQIDDRDELLQAFCRWHEMDRVGDAVIITFRGEPHALPLAAGGQSALVGIRRALRLPLLPEDRAALLRLAADQIDRRLIGGGEPEHAAKYRREQLGYLRELHRAAPDDEALTEWLADAEAALTDA